jgi:hypothetical protein
MQSFSQQVVHFEVVLRCSPDLEAQARHILQTLTLPGVQLRDGLEINIGWSVLFAHRDGEKANRLVLHEPDFTRDPLRDHRPDVSFTLALHSMQLGLVRQAGAKFVPCSYRQRLAVAPRGCLGEERVTLFRTANARFDNDSGWLVFTDAVSKAVPTETDHEILYTYELLKRRPALLQVLCLPPEYMARFKGDILDGVGGPG